MNFKIFHIFVVSLYARNLTSVWTPEMHSQRKADLSTRNGTDDFINGLSEYEKWMYSNFVSSSKLYPDKLDLLLEPGLKNFKQAVSWIPILYKPYGKGHTGWPILYGPYLTINLIRYRHFRVQ